MRTLSAELTTAQQAKAVTPYLKAVVTDGVTTYTFDNLGIDGADRRIRSVEGIEEPYGGNAVIRLKNSDQYFAAKNLKGWNVTFGWGAKVNGTYEVSNVAPLFVLNQKDTSLEGELVTELQCLDYWWKIAYTMVVRAGKRLTGTITTGFVLGELVTGAPSGATGRLVEVGSGSIIVTSVTGTFAAGDDVTGAVGSCNDVTAVDTITGGAGTDYGRNETILTILKAIVPASILDVILDSDDPDNTINTYQPLLLTEVGVSARQIIRQLLQLSKCVGRLEDDSKLHILYPDPAAAVDYTYQTDHVFWYQLRERAAILPNKVLFVNHMPGSVPEGEEQFSGVAQDDDSVTLLGELADIQINATIQSDADAVRFATAWIAQRVTEAYQGAVRAPMNCGQELYDQVRIIDSRSGVTITGRAGRIVRRYLAPINSPEHVYEIEVTLGGIVSVAGLIGGPGTLDMDLQDLTTNTLPEKVIPKTMSWQLPVSYQSYIADIDFTSVDYQTISWTAGVVRFADGREQAVTNTGSPKTLTAAHYMYVIWGNSTLQFSTTYSDAVGPDRVMVGIASKGSVAGINAYVLNPHTDSILINRDKVMDNLVNDLKLASEAVTEAKIAALAVTSGKIAAGAVIAGKIAALSIVAGDIAANAITTDKILAGAVTAVKINVATLDAISANVGTLTSGTINGVTIYAGAGAVILDGSGLKITGQILFFQSGAGETFYIYPTTTQLIIAGSSIGEIWILSRDLYFSDAKGIAIKKDAAGVLYFRTKNIAGDTNIDHAFVPLTTGSDPTGWGMVGDGTNWWYKMYSQYYYYKTAPASFQDHDDMALIRGMKPAKTSHKDKDGKEVLLLDMASIPAEVKIREKRTDTKEGEPDRYEEFIDGSAMTGLLIGAIKQLSDKVDRLEAKS